MSIYEYDEEGHLEVVKEEGRQLGLAEGKIKELRVNVAQLDRALNF